MNKNRKCPVCGGEFEDGRIAVPKGMARMGSQSWGTKINFMGVDNEKEVKVNRCKNCGYLESYAK